MSNHSTQEKDNVELQENLFGLKPLAKKKRQPYKHRLCLRCEKNELAGVTADAISCRWRGDVYEKIFNCLKFEKMKE